MSEAVQQGAGLLVILIIALATATGLVAEEREPSGDWLDTRTVQSTEFGLMKGSVQQAAE